MRQLKMSARDLLVWWRHFALSPYENPRRSGSEIEVSRPLTIYGAAL